VSPTWTEFVLFTRAAYGIDDSLFHCVSLCLEARVPPNLIPPIQFIPPCSEVATGYRHVRVVPPGAEVTSAFSHAVMHSGPKRPMPGTTASSLVIGPVGTATAPVSVGIALYAIDIHSHHFWAGVTDWASVERSETRARIGMLCDFMDGAGVSQMTISGMYNQNAAEPADYASVSAFPELDDSVAFAAGLHPGKFLLFALRCMLSNGMPDADVEDIIDYPARRLLSFL
jgi:hypothetical protein